MTRTNEARREGRRTGGARADGPRGPPAEGQVPEVGRVGALAGLGARRSTRTGIRCAVTTPEAARMSAIVAEHGPLLKGLGFRKRRHSFNRLRQDGIVHVVYFWMAPKEPPAWTEVPGLRERRYGSFRLDFGVYVPEMTRSHTPRSDWVNEYDCHLRRTIGHLLPGEPSNVWWLLDDPGASDAAGRALTEFGLPWLDNFASRASVLDAFERLGSLTRLAFHRLGRWTLPMYIGRSGDMRPSAGCWRSTCRGL